MAADVGGQSPGRRHRFGRGPCRVLRVNEDDVLTYFDQAGTKIGWEPVPDLHAQLAGTGGTPAPQLRHPQADPSQTGPRQGPMLVIQCGGRAGIRPIRPAFHGWFHGARPRRKLRSLAHIVHKTQMTPATTIAAPAGRQARSTRPLKPSISPPKAGTATRSTGSPSRTAGPRPPRQLLHGRLPVGC